MEKFHTLKCLQQEAVRLKTFKGWPKSSIKPEELAKCGFYYLHHLDYTQCFFCRGVVGSWDASDAPLEEHKRHFPNCPLIKTPDATGNVPLDSSPLSGLMAEFLNFKLEYHKPPFPKATSNFTAERAVTDSSMRLPKYATTKARQDSFMSARKGVFSQTAAMVNAGFFYSGVSDFVVCFHCGGGLYNWSEGDDPWRQHLLAYNFCPFLAQHWQNEPPPPLSQPKAVSPRSPKLSQREMSILMAAPIVKRVLRLGMSPSLVQGALAELVEERAVLPVSESEALELIATWTNKSKMDIDNETFVGAKSQVENSRVGLSSLASAQNFRPIHSDQREFEEAAGRQSRSNSERKETNPYSLRGDLRESAFFHSKNQLPMPLAAENPPNLIQSFNTRSSMYQATDRAFSSDSHETSAHEPRTVKNEHSEAEIMDVVPPRSFNFQPMESQTTGTQSTYLRSTQEARSPRDPRLNSPQDFLIGAVSKETGWRSQQPGDNARIRQLQMELHALQTSQIQNNMQHRLPSYGSGHHVDSRQVTESDIKNLANKVLELRRGVQALKQRSGCRSCRGGVPATVVALPCCHLHLCRVCSVVSATCPTCKSLIRGTVLPIRSVAT